MARCNGSILIGVLITILCPIWILSGVGICLKYYISIQQLMLLNLKAESLAISGILIHSKLWDTIPVIPTIDGYSVRGVIQVQDQCKVISNLTDGRIILCRDSQSLISIGEIQSKYYSGIHVQYRIEHSQLIRQSVRRMSR